MSDTLDASPSQLSNAVDDPLSDPEERRVLFAALDSFRLYRQAAHYNITHLRRQSFYSLPSTHVDILCEPPFSLPSHFDAVDDAISHNADIAESMLHAGLLFFGIAPEDDSWKGTATSNDMNKARSTIRQLYRDWSAEGAVEREASYRPILDALEKHLKPSTTANKHAPRVLVPGAGLGRLVLEICAAGYNVEGNEISHHQLIASNYMLNCIPAARQHSLLPWALNFSNHVSRADQFRSCAIPDVHPATVMETAATKFHSDLHCAKHMTMSAGDFSVLYQQGEYTHSFDAVTTCFFIDTAPNLITYIETIKHCLRPGGIWVNLGPLLWHFESLPTPSERDKQRKLRGERETGGSEQQHMNGLGTSSKPVHGQGIGEPGSFELSADEVVALVQRFGFQMIKQEQAPESGYIQDPRSMLQNIYRPCFWIARRCEDAVG